MTRSLVRLNWLLKIILLVVVIGYILYIGTFILAPLLFSFYMALLLFPLARSLENKGVSRTASSALLVFAFCLIIIGIGTLLVASAANFWSDFPAFSQKIKNSFTVAIHHTEDFFGLPHTKVKQWFAENSQNIYSRIGVMLSSLFESTTFLLNFLTLSPIYIFLMLLYRRNLRQFIIQIADKPHTAEFFDILKNILVVVKGYLYGTGLVVLIIAVLNTSLLLVLDIKYAFLIGALTSTLTIIPYLGTLSGGGIMVLIALMTKDSLIYPITVLLGYILIQFLEGNFITPKVVGNKVNINPLVAILSLLIGGSLWGILGMVLSLPVAATIRIGLLHIPSLKPFSLLMQTYIGKEKNETWPYIE